MSETALFYITKFIFAYNHHALHLGWIKNNIITIPRTSLVFLFVVVAQTQISPISSSRMSCLPTVGCKVVVSLCLELRWKNLLVFAHFVTIASVSQWSSEDRERKVQKFVQLNSIYILRGFAVILHIRHRVSEWVGFNYAHPTQFQSFQRRTSQLIAWLMLT